VTDHGMRGGDELNLVTPGANFGWPAVTYGTHYDGRPAVNAESHGDHSGYDHPVIAFVPSIAPSGALAVENFDPAWNGQILIAAFDGHLYRVFHRDGRGDYAAPIFLGPRLRDIDQLDDGTIVIWTDNRRILYLRPSAIDTQDSIDGFLASLDDETLRTSTAETFGNCRQCHGLGPGAAGSGPSLHGVCGRSIAGGDWNGYSAELHSVGGSWTEERLAAFIAAPEDFAPGNTMPWGGIDDPAIAGTVAALVCDVTDGEG
jgi:cytochrome c2